MKIFLFVVSVSDVLTEEELLADALVDAPVELLFEVDVVVDKLEPSLEEAPVDKLVLRPLLLMVDVLIPLLAFVPVKTL